MTIHSCEMYPPEATWDAIYEAIDDGRQPPWPATHFHLEQQDTALPGWAALLELVEEAASDRRETFSPKEALGVELWAQVITLPSSIAKLKHVKKLNLYRSNLLRIPPEIGDMESLEEFTPYTSYGLHWFPYEITRCTRLKSSTVSTRALYGNYKYRPPFPALDTVLIDLVPSHCSVCNGPLANRHKVHQRWLSLNVALDVLPLLVNACSIACLERLPAPPSGYVAHPHQGGTSLSQPLPE